MSNVGKYLLGAACVIGVMAIGVFAAPAVAALATGAAIAITGSAIVGGLFHLGVVTAACCGAWFARKKIKQALDARTSHHIHILEKGVHPGNMQDLQQHKERYLLVSPHHDNGEQHSLHYVDKTGKASPVFLHDPQKFVTGLHAIHGAPLPAGTNVRLDADQHHELITRNTRVHSGAPAGSFSHNISGRAAPDPTSTPLEP